MAGFACRLTHWQGFCFPYSDMLDYPCLCQIYHQCVRILSCLPASALKTTITVGLHTAAENRPRFTSVLSYVALCVWSVTVGASFRLVDHHEWWCWRRQRFVALLKVKTCPKDCDPHISRSGTLIIIQVGPHWQIVVVFLHYTSWDEYIVITHCKRLCSCDRATICCCRHQNTCTHRYV